MRPHRALDPIRSTSADNVHIPNTYMPSLIIGLISEASSGPIHSLFALHRWKRVRSVTEIVVKCTPPLNFAL